MKKILNIKVYIFGIIIFLIDLISKIIVSKTLNYHESIKVIKNFFYLTYTKNTGAAFSILEDGRILFLIVTVIVLFFINQYMNKHKLVKLELVSYSLLLGGIVGNLFDRIIYGYVIDFLDFRIFGYNYPIFNLADSFIVVGVIMLIIDNLIKEKKCKKLK